MTAAAGYLQQDWAQAPAARTQALYARLLGGESVRARPQDPVQGVLRIAGVAGLQNDVLVVRNRIFAQTLDAGWVADLLGRRPLHEAAAAWDATDRVPGQLPRGKLLKKIQAFGEGRADLTDLERALLDALADRRRRQVAWLWGTVAMVAFLGLLAGAFTAIHTYQTQADDSTRRVSTLEAYTRAHRATDTAVTLSMVAEANLKQQLAAADQARTTAESVLSLIQAGGDAAETENPALGQLRDEVTTLRARTDRLMGQLAAAESAWRHAEQALAVKARAADMPEVPAPPPSPPAPPGTEPTAQPASADAGIPGPDPVALGQAVASQVQRLDTEGDALAASVERVQARTDDALRVALAPR